MNYNNFRKRKWRNNNRNKYICETCKFRHSDLYHYNKHLLTKKHIKLLNKIDDLIIEDNILIIEEVKNIIKTKINKFDRKSYGDYTKNNDGTITLTFD